MLTSNDAYMLTPNVGPHEPAVAVSGLAGFAVAGGFVVPRADARPGREVPCGRKPTHIGTGLGDDDLGGGEADSGDGLQLFTLVGKRAHLLLDPRRQFQDRRAQLVDAFQMYSTLDSARFVPADDG